MSQIANDGAPGRRTSHGRSRPFTIRILAGAGLSLLVALVAARYSGSISNIDTQNIMARIRALRAILLGSSTPVVHAYCRPAGPMLPPPSFQPSPGDHHWTTIWVNDRSFPNDTSYAIKASIGDTEFVDLAYRSTGWIDGRRTPLSDTQFRIGSVTKLFTVLAILLSSDKISWEGPITRYVDGLSSAYEDVTIHALAGQTSGLGFMVC
jgi:CubicO group peptidase (beta-lactamase class C family)